MVFMSTKGRARLNLQREKFRLDIGRRSLTIRKIKHWDRLPREIKEAPSLHVF